MKGFFEDIESWKKHWKGMPEFIQEDQKPFQSIIVHFETLEDLHPKESYVVWKWDRWHHHVDYSQFRKHYKTKLILKTGVKIPEVIDNYGMILKTL